jgi:transcriptional regulator NrdR family protein
MRCECGGTTRVTKTRAVGAGERVVKRRRACNRCRKRWTTHECVMRKLQVHVPEALLAAQAQERRKP